MLTLEQFQAKYAADLDYWRKDAAERRRRDGVPSGDGIDPWVRARTAAFLKRAHRHVEKLDARDRKRAGLPPLQPTGELFGPWVYRSSLAAWKSQVDARLHAYVRKVRELHPRPNTPKGYAHLNLHTSNKPEGADVDLLSFTAPVRVETPALAPIYLAA